MDRRTFTLALAALSGPTLCGPARARGPVADLTRDRLAAIERRSGGTLGAFILDTATGRSTGWRADERFGQCSTFKLSLAACVLAGIDAGRIGAGEVLRYGPADLLPNSPVTGAHAAEGGMTVVALAEAAQKVSDNLAANLLLRRIGGPAALTAFWRSLGAPGCRLDRTEPELNFVPAGERRDTVTPRAIAHAVARICAGRVLSAPRRALLLRWMADTTTGQKRIRAGLPPHWRSGDKTGTGMRPGMGNLVNDIAVTFAPGAKGPLVITAFWRGPGYIAEIQPEHEGALRQVGAVAASWSGMGKV